MFLRILLISAHFHILDPYRKDKNEKNDENRQDHSNDDPRLSSSSPVVHSKSVAASSPEMEIEAASSKSKTSSSK